MLENGMSILVFYLFALLVVVASIAVVVTRRILRAAVFLAGVLLCNAGFFILLGYEFLAGVQVLVYVGGIVVLLVFAIMLTSSVEFAENRPSLRRKGWGFVAAGGFFIIVIASLKATPFPVATSGKLPNEVVMLGHRLLDYGAEGYVLPFEIISLLLLAVLIGGIIIARKSP